ncbi:MAG: CBS domain-containing protein [Candidatus Kariarchaeaceae archaeon]|jgi:CBS domain-containing protein
MAEIISIATQNPVFIRPTDKLHDAIEIMAKNGFRRLPVVWEHTLVGIITASDVLKAIHSGNLKSIDKEIHNFMTHDPIVVDRNADLSEAIQLMFQHDLGSLPIIAIRDNTLAGIVTERDLLKAFSENSFADADLAEFIITEPITHPFVKTTVKTVMKSMTEKNIRRAILVDNKKNVKGIVTISDMIRYISNEIVRTGEPNPDMLKEKAKEIANTEVLTVNINDSVSNVADLLVEKRMGGVPVVDDDNTLMGVFTERDILKLVGTYNLI